MVRRAAQIEATRRRIVEATVRMHETLGPRATTIAAIAEAARVTRLTVYRHVPDEEALYAACSAHWLARQRLPDPEAWARIDDPEERLTAGLEDLYRYYRDGEAMLTRIYGELEHVPATVRDQLRRAEHGYASVLAAAFPAAPARVRAVVGHAVSFGTWRSLCRDHGLGEREAAGLLTELALAASRADAGRAARGRRRPARRVARGDRPGAAGGRRRGGSAT
jgi:AcrR family transcriptional regulator